MGWYACTIHTGGQTRVIPEWTSDYYEITGCMRPAHAVDDMAASWIAQHTTLNPLNSPSITCDGSSAFRRNSCIISHQIQFLPPHPKHVHPHWRLHVRLPPLRPLSGLPQRCSHNPLPLRQLQAGLWWCVRLNRQNGKGPVPADPRRPQGVCAK